MIVRGVRGAKISEDIFKENLEFQILNANLIASKKHVIHTINQAKSKKRIAKNFWMEILIRASGKRQIGEAINMIGARDGNVCIICKDEETLNKVLEKIGGELDDSVLELNEEKEKRIREAFKIKGFGNTVERVLEKISLLEIKF
ncbi:KEOPS complex subunit Cgi121 [Methanocaldococcus infernus]